MAPSPIVVVPRPEIEQAVAGSEPALLEALAKGFIDFSQGKVEVAKPSHMQFASVFNPGEACVKTGCVRDSGRWTVKVASTFHNNAKLGLSNSQGVMLVFKEKTGELEGCLADGGHLTDLRTSLTAVLCVREFGPGREFGPVVGANRVLTVAIFGDGWELVEVPGVQAAVEGAQEADIVILCTPSQQPLLARCKRGALVIALGADADGKRELGPYVWWDAKAQGEGEEAVRHSFTTLADSRSQCLAFGELRYATDEKLIDEESIWEIGDQLGMPTGHAERVRAGLERTVVIDLTGSVLDAVVRARAVAPPPIATKPTPERPELGSGLTLGALKHAFAPREKHKKYK
ncbi:hypothetical protein T492DRAFT_1149918 [Pavlovales sp. CCMP2436]|nr:hypothetical protein T492DRAFT_1149918 [Pavlovales sp. CCMP2436]